MTTDIASGNESTGTIEAEILERLDALETENERLSNRITEVERENEQLKKQLDEHEQRLDGNTAWRDSRREWGWELEDRIEELEESGVTTSSDAKGGVKAGKSPSNIEECSPLGQITAIPEYLVDEQLTANPERARFIAKDIRQYGDYRLGEYVISSGDIRKVLSAKEGREIHWQTVKRVIQVLDSMGESDTRVKDKHGMIVCFEPEAVERYGNTPQSHTVVSTESGEV